MARDYKYTTKAPSSGRAAPPPGWLWFVAGLAIGLFVAVLTYLTGQHSADGTGQRAGARPEAQNTRQANTREKPSQPSGLTKSTTLTGTTEPDKQKPVPQFEFYTILPGREIRVSEQELRTQEQAPKKIAKTPDEPAPVPASAPVAASYVLQVGSFRHLGDADQLKARLVLGGFDVEIQTVSADSGDTWYRVRLGPYQDLTTVHRTRADLRKNGFSSLVLKEKR